MDELAVHSSFNPFEYRIAQLSDPRAIAVLNKLRDISDWSQRPPGGRGKGWGIGFARYKNLAAYVGVLMQLRIEQTRGTIGLHKAFAETGALQEDHVTEIMNFEKSKKYNKRQKAALTYAEAIVFRLDSDSLKKTKSKDDYWANSSLQR